MTTPLLRISLFALLLLPVLAQGAITFVNASTDRSASDTSRAPADPASTTTNDVYVALATINSEDGSWTPASGWTQIDDSVYAGGVVLHWNLSYIVRGASAPNLTWSYSGTADDIRVTVWAFRGVCTSDVLDVAWVKASHYQELTNDPTGANPGITTETADAMVLLIQEVLFSAAGTPGAPSGYTLDSTGHGTNPQHNLAYQVFSTAQAVTPGSWTHTSFNTGDDPAEWTLALQEAACGASGGLLLRRRR